VELRSNSALLDHEVSGLSDCLDRLASERGATRPLSTYRLQFHKGFRFADAIEMIPYLQRLGISHVYASPFLKARAGSMHGYDIVDHNQINPEIGSEAELQQFSEQLRRNGMGLILDTVPNHMGIGSGENPWWHDVLQNGQASEYASFFDIDWEPLKPELRDKLLLPILGNQYGEELEAGKIPVAHDAAGFHIQYYDKRLPIDPQTVPLIFESLPRFWDEPAFDKLKQVLTALKALPPHHENDAATVRQRQGSIGGQVSELERIIGSNPDVADLLERTLKHMNGEMGVLHSFDALHELLERQPYRLAHWRVSAEEINYRRFFDINDLAGLSMEYPRVFAETHRLLRRLLANGCVDGVRVDHCDGLLNPRQYLVRAQMLYAASQCSGAEPRPPVAENGIEQSIQTSFGQHEWAQRDPLMYCVVEKILEPGEQLPPEWPVDGTSGYDFTHQVNGLFIQSANEQAFTNIYHRFLGAAPDFDEVLYNSKKVVMHTALSSEVNVLTHMLDELSSCNRRARDLTRKNLRDAIRETIACFPVYRSYIDERGEISERDREYIMKAIRGAKRRNSGTASAVFDFLRDILLLKAWPGQNGDYGLHHRKLQFTLKFQQLTGPVMAKGLEDTAGYVYNRFVSVNEVGGSPDSFGTTVDEFHSANQHRAEQWPFTMLATSTHDTKRSEDVRARLNVLSEMPREWSALAMRWKRGNADKKITLPDGRTVPDANEEYLLYQTLLGAWPANVGQEAMRGFEQRLYQYMDKALHEAKINLSWINPDPEYVEGVQAFIAALFAPTRNYFVRQVERIMQPLGYFGAINSIAQTLLKLTSPGVPDVYQGNELLDFSLVDPDNRRPVDFAARQKLLAELDDPGVRPESATAAVLAQVQDGRAKLWVTARALRFRAEHPELFRKSAYVPLAPKGEKSQHLVAFAREREGRACITAVPRLAFTLMRGKVAAPLWEVWGDTAIPLPAANADVFMNVLTGEEVRATSDGTLFCRDIFRSFPVALLMAN
jgi:(1->4)-alpha-D-glucan 1-alpha-D-glucosylmutase